MSPAANLRDLEMHAEHFRLRQCFTYTVLRADWPFCTVDYREP